MSEMVAHAPDHLCSGLASTQMKQIRHPALAGKVNKLALYSLSFEMRSSEQDKLCLFVLLVFVRLLSL